MSAQTPRITVHGDAFIQAKTIGKLSEVVIRDNQHHTLVVLHLHPTAVHELRNAAIRLTIALDAQAIEAAGSVVTVPGNTFPAMNQSATS